ncbi:unnamed protein product [Acanthoscelides obtectus]|uniref:Transcription initiation factor TFIID component TAF4 C-terminal domain-containing protein n=1 Tax=Acanthoscelides obtectus TaxID=200917 RepID=A0A9P0JM29_ACAOB|nr:unnamed protein product [Acanthoscelides obtectus]CAK1658035.1 Transcription initiation factor TFIID subunit 4 [Acanthoscelides obtectus]
MEPCDLSDPALLDVAACISLAVEQRVRYLLERLSVIAEHRTDSVKNDSRYKVSNDVRRQLKFLEDVDVEERETHEESEREVLFRAARNRSRFEDGEQARLKARVREMQRLKIEELRQREANATALQAIGPRKRPKRLEGHHDTTMQFGEGPSNIQRLPLPPRQRVKKVTMRDVQLLFETEKDMRRSTLLYKLYLK